MTTDTNNGVQTPAMPSESTKTPKSIMPKPLQPLVCVQRDENTLVPLIAIDELPDSVVLKGVPLKLTLIEALKARIELINIDYPAQGARYELDRPVSIHVDTSEHSDDSESDISPISEGSVDSTKKELTRSDKKGNKNMKDKAVVRMHSPFTPLTLPLIMPMLILFNSSSGSPCSLQMTIVSLIPWQRRVPWGKRFTAPIGSKPATATTCRKGASISTRFPKTKRPVALSASVNSLIGLERKCLLGLLQLSTSRGDVKTESPKTQSLSCPVLQAHLIAVLILLLLHLEPQTPWLAPTVNLQPASPTKLPLLTHSTIPTPWDLPHPTSISPIMLATRLSSVHFLKALNLS